MFKILVKVVIPHLYRYDLSLTSKYMFESLGKSCYRSLNFGAGMPEQILKTEVRLFKDSSISHSTSKYGQSTLAESRLVGHSSEMFLKFGDEL